MKRFTILLLAAILANNLEAQHLIAPYSDVVGVDTSEFTSFIVHPAYLVEADVNSLYLLGLSHLSPAYHPDINGLNGDMDAIFFIKYKKKAVPVWANHIINASAMGAYSHSGGLMISGYSDSVVIEGNGYPLMDGSSGSSYDHFIASFDTAGRFIRLIDIWNGDAPLKDGWDCEIDKREGSIYLAGPADRPYDLKDHGPTGTTGPYMIVLKYDRDLNLQGVFTATSDTASGSSTSTFDDIEIIPVVNGEVIVTGKYNSETPLMFGGSALDLPANNTGQFAFKLDSNLGSVWAKTGDRADWSGYVYISEGFAMQNGDVIMTGLTNNGYFQLGDAEFVFGNGSGYMNLFLFRMAPDGKVVWTRPIQNMGVNFGYKKGSPDTEEQKGIQSEEFMGWFYKDAVRWNDKAIYLASTFLTDSFEVAGKVLKKKLQNGLFVASIDAASGEENWGYAMSSKNIGISGFDLDSRGKVSLAGYSHGILDMETLGTDSIPDVSSTFLIGLDRRGSPLWYNRVPAVEYDSTLTVSQDLEVLQDGDVFITIYKETPDPFEIGGTKLSSPYRRSLWLVGLVEGPVVGGRVTDISGLPVYPGYVKAYKSADTGAYPLEDSTRLDSTGYYLFKGNSLGNYALKVMPDTIRYPDGIPTYYGDAVVWSGATIVEFAMETRDSTRDVALVELRKLTPADGSGEMSGNIIYSDDAVIKGTVAKPVTRTSVILVRKAQQKSVQSIEIVAYVETDEQGNFLFIYVPNGDYTLIVDIPGLPMFNTYEVTIEENMIVSGLDFVVGKYGINPKDKVDVKTVSMGQIMIFPNPGNGLMHMEFPLSRDYHVDVYNNTGQLVYSKEYPATAGLVLMDISGLENGIYLIRIEGDRASGVFKYVKE